MDFIKDYILNNINKDNNYVVVITQNAIQARDIILELKWKIPNINRLTANCIDFTIDDIECRIESFEKGSSLRGLCLKGQRPTTIILDNIRIEKYNDSIRQRDEDWLVSHILFLSKYTRIVMFNSIKEINAVN